MASISAQRAAVLGLVLALVASSAAVADTVVTDGDAVAAGNQSMVDLGEVARGATVPVSVALRLTCKGTSHVAAGVTIAVSVDSQTVPAGGVALVTPGSIDVPAGWPAPGEGCPGLGLPTILGTVPASLTLTAPTIVGSGYEYTFLFVANPAAGITNTTAFSATLDVVEPKPADTTPPVLDGVPADQTVFTSGTSAVVAWTDPTATDDTDPAPRVACDPASGSVFQLGTTTVICTATDATGNSAAGTFDVTVRQLAAAWGRPLDDAVPALVGQLGRTILLKLFLTAGGAGIGPGGAGTPGLILERLNACVDGAAALETRDGGAFNWDDGAWRLNLRTDDLAGGCWRLTASLDGGALATAIVRLVPEGALKDGPRMPSRHTR